MSCASYDRRDCFSVLSLLSTCSTARPHGRLIAVCRHCCVARKRPRKASQQPPEASSRCSNTNGVLQSLAHQTTRSKLFLQLHSSTSIGILSIRCAVRLLHTTEPRDSSLRLRIVSLAPHSRLTNHKQSPPADTAYTALHPNTSTCVSDNWHTPWPPS